MPRIASLLIISFCLCGPLLAGCSSEPENVADMLIYVGKNYQKKPDQALAAYQRFLPEAEEALIQAALNIGDSDLEKHYDRKKILKINKDGLWAFLEHFAGDRAFLDKIMEISARYPHRSGVYDHNEFNWMREHAPERYQAWLESLPFDDGRLYLAWYHYRMASPDEALSKALHLAVKKTEEESEALSDKAREELKTFILGFGRQKLKCEHYEFIYANGLHRNLVNRWEHLNTANWLSTCPDDLGLALRTNLNGAYSARFRAPLEILPQGPIEPSPEGNKVLIILDGSQCREYADLYDQGVNSQAMSALPDELKADSLRRYDRKIVIAPRGRPLDIYYKGWGGDRPQALAWDVTMSYFDAQSGELLAEKVISSGRPPDRAEIPQGAKYVLAELPWSDIAQYIKELASGVELDKK